MRLRLRKRRSEANAEILRRPAVPQEAFAAAFRRNGSEPFVKGGPVRRSAFLQENHMNRELIINVTPTEISIALAEDKVLVELNKEQCQTGFSVGDIYLGKVRKIMPA